MADLPDVAVGQPHSAAHNDERHVINSLSALTTALSPATEPKDGSGIAWSHVAGKYLSGAQPAQAAQRQHVRGNRLAAASSDVTSYVINGTADSSLTKSYSYSVTGTTGGQARLVSNAELNLLPMDPGNGRPTVYNVSGIGYLVPTPNSANIDSPATFPQINTRMIRFMCDGPKVDVILFSPIQNNLFQVFVDGVPVNAGAVPLDVGYFSYLHLVFPSAKPRLVEIRTGAYLGPIATGPLYKLWKPRPLRGTRVLAVGDSYMQPLVWNATSGAAEKDMYGWAQGVEDYLDVEDMWIEGIGGTGFVQRASGSYGAPNNNYLDRVSGHIAVAPDVLLVGSAFGNDMYAGNTPAVSVANANNYLTQMRTALPYCKFILLTGYRAPVYGDNSGLFATCVSALQLLRQDVYYIDTAAIMDMAGYTPGHTTGGGNSDIYIGADGIHLTVAGHLYFRGRVGPAIQACIQDTGSLVNTLIAA